MGLANYEFILSDSVFWQAVGNTFFYTSVSYPRHHAAVAHSGCVVERQKLEVCNRLARDVLHTRRSFYRSDIANFQMLLNENSGLLNVPLIALGLEPINWLGDAHSSRSP